MKNNFTPELIAKARQAQSVAELITLAEENDITITQDEAEDYFAQLQESCNQSGELSADELANVSGGGCLSKTNHCPKCGGTIVYHMYHPYIGGYHNFCNKCKTVYD